LLQKEIGHQIQCLVVSGSSSRIVSSLPLSYNIADADLDGLVDKKGGPEDMYELAREADIVITCMTLNSESVNPSLCSF
jgi:hypothetical protein